MGLILLSEMGRTDDDDDALSSGAFVMRAVVTENPNRSSLLLSGLAVGLLWAYLYCWIISGAECLRLSTLIKVKYIKD